MFRFMIALCCMFGLLSAGAVAQAAECSGHDYYKVELADTLDLGDGHSVTLFKANAILQNDNPASPDHLIAGPCSGYVEVLPDGGLKMDGYCNRTNADGDISVDHWWQNVGDDRGSYETIRATGKLAKMVGAKGWFETEMENGALGASDWGGDCP